MALPSRSTATQNDVLGQEIDVRTPAVAEEFSAEGATAPAGTAGKTLRTPRDTTVKKDHVTTMRRRPVNLRSPFENIPMSRARLLRRRNAG
jgi:hypothetical protein